MRFGLPLTRCLREVTERQYRVLLTWMEEEWNRPDRTDAYLMQVACEVRRVLAKNPSSVQLKHFRLKFETPRSKAGPALTREQAAALSKARWFSAVGFRPRNPNTPAATAVPARGPASGSTPLTRGRNPVRERGGPQKRVAPQPRTPLTAGGDPVAEFGMGS